MACFGHKRSATKIPSKADREMDATENSAEDAQEDSALLASGPLALHKKYDAFISYRRLPDERIAAALQRGLESLAKPWLAWRAIRVFRDITSIPASADLGGE